MEYRRMKFSQIINELDSEEKARAWIWLAKFDGKEFCCSACKGSLYYQYKKNPEIRKCQECCKQVRIRSHTIFQNSKISLLVWLKAINFVTQGKRGVSALELQSQLKMKSYGTTWVLLHKIREALRQRDEEYKLNNIIELDGGTFWRRHTGNQADVLVAIESKDWIDKNGKPKSKAGFAKVIIASETKEEAKKFVDNAVNKNSTLHTDGSPSFTNLDNVKIESRTVNADKEILDLWLPWVHKFISNAKSWIVGTHHGVEAKYLGQYLSEYTYRFNRRHDPDSLFFRALAACVHAKSKVSGTLFG